MRCQQLVHVQPACQDQGDDGRMVTDGLVVARQTEQSGYEVDGKIAVCCEASE